ncbi:hypothetical protein HMPREF3034_01651 [Prevotella sp. DNF00663]|uniref:hypothetical protein n=1 Tax=unclassified Prevotella TaxID=2638335 RepID=UPI0005144D74|nr:MULTISPECIES: hypothetical protein [unclassified Prevotella]KGI60946.1 hypothetical protein HMPREF0671_03080 [Prevotella sp. S7 MS 2]KXB82382.1 hypothetical protein HMPREF3034_01651 [Prevotella sp. DNF00663]
MKRFLVGAAMMVATIGFVSAQQGQKTDKKPVKTECCAKKDAKCCDKKTAQCGKDANAASCKKGDMKKCCSSEAKTTKKCNGKKMQCDTTARCDKK